MEDPNRLGNIVALDYREPQLTMHRAAVGVPIAQDRETAA